MKNKYKYLLKKLKKKKFRNRFLLIIMTGIFVMATMQSCSSSLYTADDIRQIKIEESKQFNDGKFENSKEIDFMSAGSLFSSMWDWITSSGEFRPEEKIPSVKLNIEELLNNAEGQIKFSWFGHSSTIINFDGKIIMTDPVFDESLSIVGPSRFDYNFPVNPEELPEIDLIIISHNHRDHLSISTLKKLAGKTNMFIMPLGVGSDLEEINIPEEKIVELDWWEEFQISDNFGVAATPGQHFSGRGLTDRNKTLWASWVIKRGDKKIFFSGDTGYFDGFKKIGEKYGPFDLSLMECGQYGDNWAPIHMTPEESVQANVDIKSELMMPIHWSAFKLALHDWFEPVERAIKKGEELGVKIITPKIGEIVKVEKNADSEKWWKKYKGINEND